MATGESIRIVTVNGSVRPGNYTGKALAIVRDELELQEGVSVVHLEPAKMDLPLPGINLENDDTSKLRDTLSSATGVVLSTPEYHGGLSSVIKLVIEHLGYPSAIAKKPVVLLGVAAGAIGAIKSLEQLSSMCQHVGAIVLPGSVSVANVQKVIDVQGAIHDERVEKRIRGLAHSLLDYVHEYICPKIAMEEMVRSQ